MALTYEHEERNDLGDQILILEFKGEEITIEDDCGRRCVLNYDQLALVNTHAQRYRAARQVVENV